MKSSTLAELAELGAPLAPLERVKIHRIASRAGKVWHRDQSAYPRLQVDRMCCRRSSLVQDRSNARRMTVSVADAFRDDLQLCSEDGCGLPGPVANYTYILGRALSTVVRFDDAAAHGEWPVANQYARMLDNVATGRSYRLDGDTMFSAEEHETLAAWVRSLYEPRKQAVDAALANYATFINRAFAAWMVPVVLDEVDECGADPAYVPVARDAWQRSVESLDIDDVVRAEVVDALSIAAKQVGEDPSDPAPFFDLCDKWWAHADRLADRFEHSPRVVLVGPKAAAPLSSGNLTRSANSFRVLAAHLHPTVHHNDATASLVPVQVAHRVRGQTAADKGQATSLRRTAVIEPNAQLEFEQVAHTALALWDPSADSWSSPLATAAGAWAAAEATHHSSS